MLVACRLAGLSALEAHYAGVRARTQCEARARTMRGPGESASDVVLRLASAALTHARALATPPKTHGRPAFAYHQRSMRYAPRA